MTDCTCQVGPGKFEGESALTYLAYYHVLHGDSDTSTFDGGNATDWFRRPFNFDAEAEAVPATKAYGYCDRCIKEALEDESFGLSVRTSPDGFVSLARYLTEKQYDAALNEAERDEEASAWQ